MRGPSSRREIAAIDPRNARTAQDTFRFHVPTAKGVPADVVPARATNDPGGWVTYGDYPRSVTNRKREGSLQFVYEIDERGRVSACEVFETSGEPDIDRTVCASIVARARFSPATYKGQPVSAIGTNFFTYDIPGE